MASNWLKRAFQKTSNKAAWSCGPLSDTKNIFRETTGINLETLNILHTSIPELHVGWHEPENHSPSDVRPSGWKVLVRWSKSSNWHSTPVLQHSNIGLLCQLLVYWEVVLGIDESRNESTAQFVVLRKTKTRAPPDPFWKGKPPGVT